MEKTIDIEHIMSKDEFLESEELQEIFEPHAQWELDKMIKIWNISTFIAVYIVDADPKVNYGLNFKLYRHYLDVNGIERIAEIVSSHCLDNSHSIVVKIDRDIRQITDTGLRIPKSTNGRVSAVKNRHILM